MKKISTIGTIALMTAITFAACTKNDSSNPVPNKLGTSTFLRKDTVTPPHTNISIRDTVTPPIKSFSAAPLPIKKDTVTPPHTNVAIRDTVTPPRKPVH